METKDIFSMKAVEMKAWQETVDKMPNSPDRIEQLLSDQQLMLLVGRHGIGKTNELLHLFHKFMYGGNWHGLSVVPCPVLYIGWEGDPRKMNKRLDIINYQYLSKEDKPFPGYFKMRTKKLALNTDEGRQEYKQMIKSLKPQPLVVLLDPFKRTVIGDYSKPPIADSWIEGATSLARQTNTSIIADAHTNKITYRTADIEDTLSADKVKGAGDLLDGISSAVMLAEQVGSKREKVNTNEGEFSVVKWRTLSIIIKVLKARDAIADLPLLKTKFDHERLCLTGQEWVVNRDGTIAAEESV